MAEPLDYLILIGIEEPDESTDSGKSAIRHLMDAANVQRNGIKFFKLGTSLHEVARGSFPIDREKKEFVTGNALCLCSEDANPKYRHMIDGLGDKLGISVQTGMQTVNLSEMRESEMSEWITNGSYTPLSAQEIEEEKKRSGEEGSILLSMFNDDDEDEDDEDDFINSILDDDEDDEFVSETPQEESHEPNDSGRHRKQQEDSVLEDDPYDADDDFFDSFGSDDEPSDDFFDDETDSKPRHAKHRTVEEDEPSAKTVREPRTIIDDDTSSFDDFLSDIEDEPSKQSSISREEEEPLSLDFDDDFDFEDDDYSLPDKKPSESVSKKEKTQEDISAERRDRAVKRKRMTVDGVPGSSSANDSYEDFIEDKYKTDDIDEAVDEDESLDDNLLIRQRNEERLKAKRRKLAELKKARSKSQPDTTGTSGGSLRDIGGDDLAHSSGIMEQTANDMTEESTNADGSRKTYKEYLAEKQKRQQNIEESSREAFGDIATKTNDSRYVGKDMGRIILVTSGKGGVGKSLVSNGMAIALSLARAKEMRDNPGANPSKVWLIESDYNSPQLAITYGTGKKHLGNVADVISAGGDGVSNDKVRRAIEDNVFIDKETGVHVLSCPPLSQRRSSKEIPYAIILAIKYASDRGGDVIVDHGNLTDGEYSELDFVLSMRMAHRIVLVCNMGCIPETQSSLSILTERRSGSSSPIVPHQAVSVVLNTARQSQFHVAQDKLAPHEIINFLPAIDSLRPENSMSGETNIRQAPKDVQKAIIGRCGNMLRKLGYADLKRYFIDARYGKPKKSRKRSILSRISDRLAGG